MEKRDPNGPLPVNWQRRVVLADRIYRNASIQVNPEEADSKPCLYLGDSPLKPGEFIFVSPKNDYEWPGPAPAFRIGRITTLDPLTVNWLIRPSDVFYNRADTRELFLSFETNEISNEDVRGRCVVLCEGEIRNFERFREQPCQFWFSKLWDLRTRRLLDVVVAPKNSKVKYLALAKSSKHKITSKMIESANLAKENDAEDAAEWPFVFFDGENAHPRPLYPQINPEQSHTVDDWPGKPLTYYTVVGKEPISVETHEKVDTSPTWVQEMPNGYLARGTDTTSTPVSLPSKDLGDFVSKCQGLVKGSDKLIDVNSVGFIDACCATLTNTSDFESSLTAVQKFTREDLMEPQLSSSQVDQFRDLISPFSLNTWHTVFRKMKSIPISELTQFLWVDVPKLPRVSQEREMTDYSEELKCVCAICATDDAQEWLPFPAYLPLKDTDADETVTYSLCIRCARLWYRYRTPWQPSSVVQSIAEICEPELVSDSKGFIQQEQKREKRRLAAQERKDQLAVKRLESRKAKLEKKIANSKDKEKEAEQKAEVDQIAKEIEVLSEKSDKEPSAKRQKTLDSDDKETNTTTNTKTNNTKKPAVKNTGTKVKGNGKKATPEPEKVIETETVDTEENATKSDSETEYSDTDFEKKPRGRLRLSLDLAYQTVAKIYDESGLDIHNPPDYCVVCGQYDPSMAQKTCYYCKLNVHEQCYGSRPSGSVWKCDCCANLFKQGNNHDMNYQCALCPVRFPNYGQWLNGTETENAPDALKGTVDGMWCHSRCTIFVDGVKFGDPDQLCDVDVSQVSESLFEGTCSVCLERSDRQLITEKPDKPASNGNSKADKEKGDDKANDKATDKNDKPTEKMSDCLQKVEFYLACAKLGAKVKCELCDARFHVSCAADTGCQLGFTKEEHPRPVIVCSRHQTEDLTPISYVDMETGLTAMQSYAIGSKSGGKKPSGHLWATKSLEREHKGIYKASQLPPLAVSETDNRLEYINDMCTQCRSTRQSYLLRSGNDLICSVCFRFPENLYSSGCAKLEYEEEQDLVERYTNLLLSKKNS